jgi:hypothetical protein
MLRELVAAAAGENGVGGYDGIVGDGKLTLA